MDPFTRHTEERFFEHDQLQDAWNWAVVDVCQGLETVSPNDETRLLSRLVEDLREPALAQCIDSSSQS